MGEFPIGGRRAGAKCCGRDGHFWPPPAQIRTCPTISNPVDYSFALVCDNHALTGELEHDWIVDTVFTSQVARRSPAGACQIVPARQV